MAEHTKLPWRIERVSRFGEYDVLGANGEQVAACYVTDGADEPEEYPSEANAAFIVKACNAHEALVKALQDLSKMYSHAWDVVDGGLMMHGNSIDHFESAHHAAQVALHIATGSPLPISDDEENAEPGVAVTSAQRGGE